MTDIAKPPAPSRSATAPSTAWATAPCSSPGPACSGRRRIATRRVAVLREAVASGVNHIDTSDFYGPHVTNQIIREALHPYPDDLVIVTKIGAGRGADASWIPALSRRRS